MPSDTAPGRLIAIDLARAAALIAMIVFHFGRDLDLYGVWPPGSTFTPGWMWSARLIAGTFIFLAGVSLWLAHGHGLRWPSYLRRLAMLIAAAVAVSVATYVAVPGAWVRFGILHSIALSSVIGLAFLRLPAWIAAAAGTALIAAVAVGPVPALSGSAWLWLGLGANTPPMIDWEPVIPWTGPFLLGLALAKLADSRGWFTAMEGRPAAPLWTQLSWPGRHSLAIYLIHQPILVGGILAWQRVIPG
ncbi:heparan-alpha-glucosaminide N-acetyltransferase [Jannaschia aquimarina]|uniref:Heparan-alpha-glucosaminide N-acetyltransferase catalytic domain-containing protein n=1 Tax=Jannaschia aquimarina TaxID=935700 RepID=A0A0D1EPZ6_9RHOB|nr:heparan-alpha-glucosaminide N-acetyltransferase [Jannaschia aquimarina]KIT17695.1 hypothetical protein jaqu_05860 [Jannaschia aquimarina]SNS78849.1 Uncharacterized membrane protein [Jannaschia aquimarina]